MCRGHGVLGLRQINTFRKVSLQVKFLDDDVLHCLHESYLSSLLQRVLTCIPLNAETVLYPGRHHLYLLYPFHNLFRSWWEQFLEENIAVVTRPSSCLGYRGEEYSYKAFGLISLGSAVPSSEVWGWGWGWAGGGFWARRRIHVCKNSLKFLGIILKVLRLQVSVWIS